MSKSLLLLALLLPACGSDATSAPHTSAPADAAGPRDWCASVPAEIANLALGGAATRPESNGGPNNGTCTWKGTGDAQLMVGINQNGVDREIFDQGCHDYSASTIPTTFGVAACNNANDVTLVLADGDTILMAIGYQTTDTDHHLAVLKAVYDRVKH
jgi:hypothetical protein